jgi:fluoride exporter
MTPTKGVIVLNNLLLVAAGAILGGLARFLTTHYFSELSRHHGFPIGTLLVNLVGCVLVGYVLTWTADHASDRWRLFLATGICGAFTTFSAFAYESMAYWHQGRFREFAINVVANNVLSLAAVLVGIRLRSA